jgi:hypothetical protein
MKLEHFALRTHNVEASITVFAKVGFKPRTGINLSRGQTE